MALHDQVPKETVNPFIDLNMNGVDDSQRNCNDDDKKFSVMKKLLVQEMLKNVKLSNWRNRECKLERSESSSSSSSPYGHSGHRRRLRPEMISRPQGDFVHASHVGADGAFFGDISFLGDNYQLSASKQQILYPNFRSRDNSLSREDEKRDGHEKKLSITEKLLLQYVKLSSKRNKSSLSTPSASHSNSIKHDLHIHETNDNDLSFLAGSQLEVFGYLFTLFDVCQA